jgi:tRNA-splicing ligase RtcB (3'-phosphate/5'-hydroxy nucleic acid ligase)
MVAVEAGSQTTQLAAAPIRSPEGEAYLGAMAAAANFAFANRQLITHSTRQAFASAGFDSEDHHLRVLYDLAHNNAKFEEHDGREVLVHRKGATRAFGLGNEELPESYRSVGQPVPWCRGTWGATPSSWPAPKEP